MSLDLDDPWVEDLALERAESAHSVTSRHRASSAPQPPSADSTLTTPLAGSNHKGRFSPSRNHATTLPIRSGSPKSETLRGKANRLPSNLSRAAGQGSTTSRQPTARSASHPLALDRMEQLSITSDTDVSDVSRPALRRMTSITDRQVAESLSLSRAGSEIGSSERGSVDLARAEVEVIIHQVKNTESLPGIALRYGIDLAILRKVNKLWPSDPVHLRNHLYVPLDACRPTLNGDQIVRGPGEGQVTIVPHRKRPIPKGTAAATDSEARTSKSAAKHRNGEGSQHQRTYSGNSGSGTIRAEDMQYDRPGTPDTITASENGAGEDGSEQPQVLDIVRLPASKLRFFPNGKPETPRSRASLDSDMGRSADSVRSLSAAERARRREARERARSQGMGRSVSATMFAPLGAFTTAAEGAVVPPKKRVVRLRPPQAPTPKDDSLVGAIKNLFSVPPPPVRPVPTRPRTTVRVPVVRTDSPASTQSAPPASAWTAPLQPPVELDAGPWGVGRSLSQTMHKTDKKRD